VKYDTAKWREGKYNKCTRENISEELKEKIEN
jgi:hypothetical protein